LKILLPLTLDPNIHLPLPEFSRVAKQAVVVVHNFYQHARGEDGVFADETRLLEANGHPVTRFTVHNDQVEMLGKLALARKTIWNSDTAGKLREVVRREKPAVVHFHNTFPLVSPAAYYAARKQGAAVVQTLHNYRLLCPAAVFMRDGKVCEDCLGKTFPLPAVKHKCYRGNLPASVITATLLASHRVIGTWKNAVDVYIALTEFAKQKFIEGGLPANKIIVKPNFVDPDPGAGAGTGGYAVFAGRFSPEKGLETLLDAWDKLDGKVPLKIMGDGPQAGMVQERVARLKNVEWLGRKPLADVYQIIGDASFLVLPSIWYEGFPKTIVESFAKGTPVLASNLGSMTELIDPGKTGLLFKPGDPSDLAMQVNAIMSDPTRLHDMRTHARQKYEAHYTATQNYRHLRDIYDVAVETRHAR